MFVRYIISLISLIAIEASYAESPAKPPLKVGMLLPLSGNFAALGKDTQEGIEIALQVSKDRNSLQLFFADSKADPTASITEFRKLAAVDQVLAVYILRGPVGMAVNPLSLTAGIPLLGGVANKDFAAGNKYAFQAWSKSDLEGEFYAKTINDAGHKKIALITAQDDFTHAVSAGFRQSLKDSHQADLVFDEEANPNEQDFRAALLRIKKSGADVVFMNLAINQFVPFMRQLRENRLPAKVYSNFWVAKKEILEGADSEIIEGVRFVEMNTDLPKFKHLLHSKFGTTPSGATLSAYSATLLLAQTAANNSSIANAAELYEALLKENKLVTPDGDIEIKERCLHYPLVVREIRNGEGVIVSQ